MQLFNIVLIFGFSSVILADNSCIFQHPTKGVVNLTSLALRNGQPRFRDVLSSLASSFSYSFNPCYSFTENTCQNAAVCQITSNKAYSYTLGTQNQARWTVDTNDRPVLTYTYGSKTVSISMICALTGQDEFEVIGEDVVNHYSMNLRSRCACWNGCGSHMPTTTTSTHAPPPTTSSISYNACKYHHSQYGTIDLSSIGNVKGDPQFKDVASTHPNNYVWSYNPCYTFSEDNCRNVAGCQMDKSHDISYTIGMQEYAFWINMNNTKNLLPSIVYLSSSYRRLTVQLICDRSTSDHYLNVLGEMSLGEYVMQLTSPCACWNGCIKPSPHPMPFKWTFWMTLGIASGAVFALLVLMVTCLMCSKPRRRYHPVMIVNEKTPFIARQY